MSDSIAAAAAHGVRPGQPAPELIVDLLSGGTYDLADQEPAAFTMVLVLYFVIAQVLQLFVRYAERRVDRMLGRRLPAEPSLGTVAAGAPGAGVAG